MTTVRTNQRKGSAGNALSNVNGGFGFSQGKQVVNHIQTLIRNKAFGMSEVGPASSGGLADMTNTAADVAAAATGENDGTLKK